MKGRWLMSNKFKLLGYNCLRQSIKTGNTYELGLFGKYGMVWINNSTTCKAYIHNIRISKKRANDRILITFPNNELAQWIKWLKIPVRYRSKQVKYSLLG